jgi:hypothetical protein
MSDLRTRIAAVLRQELFGNGGDGDVEPEALADAVIAELKLEKQTLNREMWAAAPNVHRYTTPWKDNDD